MKHAREDYNPVMKDCPFCKKAMRIKNAVNPMATCETPGCFMHESRLAITADDPVTVERWNRRA